MDGVSGLTCEVTGLGCQRWMGLTRVDGLEVWESLALAGIAGTCRLYEKGEAGACILL